MAMISFEEAYKNEPMSVFRSDGSYVNGCLSDMRVDRSTIPEGWHAYDLRDNSDGIPCELVNGYVMVNHMGTFLTQEDLGLKQGESLFLADKDRAMQADEFQYALSRAYTLTVSCPYHFTQEEYFFDEVQNVEDLSENDVTQALRQKGMDTFKEQFQEEDAQKLCQRTGAFSCEFSADDKELSFRFLVAGPGKDAKELLAFRDAVNLSLLEGFGSNASKTALDSYTEDVPADDYRFSEYYYDPDEDEYEEPEEDDVVTVTYTSYVAPTNTYEVKVGERSFSEVSLRLDVLKQEAEQTMQDLRHKFQNFGLTAESANMELMEALMKTNLRQAGLDR